MQQYIPWIISAISVTIAVMTYTRNGRKDQAEEIREEGQQMASVKEALLKANMKLDQVCATTNETRSDIKSQSKDLQRLETRITVVERDLKTAFSKIDDMKGVIEK